MSRSRVEHLTREVQQLQLQNEEQARSTQLLVQQKDQQLQQQLQASRRESEQVVATLQWNLEQKDATIRAKNELLQEKQSVIRKLQQQVGERERSGEVMGPLKLEWFDGPPAPFATKGYFVAHSGDFVYCVDGESFKIILMFNSATDKWTVLPECPKVYFSIAMVNERLTAIGGKFLDKPTNTLLSLPQNRPGIFQKKWIEQLPPMSYCHNAPAVVTANTSLVVAGGWGPDKEKAPVEVLDIRTLRWFTVASLRHPLWQATATFSGGRLYVGGGFSGGQATNSVMMCEMKDLLQSQPQPQHTIQGVSSSPPVWKDVAPLPVVWSSLITFQGQLLAIGGSTPTTRQNTDATSEVRQYDATTNSWKVISQMKMKRAYSLAVVLPNNTLMVCGGITPARNTTNSVEIGLPYVYTHTQN